MDWQLCMGTQSAQRWAKKSLSLLKMLQAVHILLRKSPGSELSWMLWYSCCNHVTKLKGLLAQPDAEADHCSVGVYNTVSEHNGCE